MLLLFIGAHPVLCQKIVKKTMLLSHIEGVQIDAERFSEVRLTTIPGAELRLEATMEGEYQRDIGIEITEIGNTLRITGSFPPFFKAPNDKLSAHKVVAVTLMVQLPENQFVGLYGTSTRVVAGGAYRELEIVLNDGQSFLHNPEGIIRVVSQSGDIVLNAGTGVLNASTKYGKVHIQELSPGRNQYSLQSVRGDIFVRRNR